MSDYHIEKHEANMIAYADDFKSGIMEMADQLRQAEARVEELEVKVAELDGEISVDIEDFDAQYGIRVFAKRCEKGVWSGKLNRPGIVAIDLKQTRAEGKAI